MKGRTIDIRCSVHCSKSASAGSSYPSGQHNSRGGEGSHSGRGDSISSQSTGSEANTLPSDSPQEKALALNVAQKITPFVLQLNPGEISLGIHTASFSGRKSKDADGISNQVKICLEHLRIHGGVDALRVLTFTECDLTTIDMIYFGNTMLQYPLLLKYLDFSYNRIGDIGTISLINSFVTSPTGKFPMHHVINLNLSNNGIGDEGAGHIAAYLKGGYLPALKILDVSGNNITPAGEGYFVAALKSPNVQNMIITLQKTIDAGIKNYASFLKQKLKDCEQKGIDVKNIIVSKSFWNNLKLYNIMERDLVVNFIKCKLTVDLDAASLSKDALIIAGSKSLAKGLNMVDYVLCAFETVNESFESQVGAEIAVQHLELIGSSELIEKLNE